MSAEFKIFIALERHENRCALRRWEVRLQERLVYQTFFDYTDDSDLPAGGRWEFL